MEDKFDRIDQTGNERFEVCIWSMARHLGLSEEFFT